MLIELEEYASYTRQFVPGKGILRLAPIIQIFGYTISLPVILFVLIAYFQNSIHLFYHPFFLVSVSLLTLSISVGRFSKSKQRGQKYSLRGAMRYSLYIENMVIMFNRLCQWSYNVNDPDIKQRILAVEFELSRVIRILNMQRNLTLATVAGVGAATIMGARSFVRNLK